MVVGPSAEDDELRWLILFDSIHQVLAAEWAFQQCGVWCDLVPTPRDLSSDCGMAIAFRQRDLDAVGMILEDLPFGMRNVYQPSPDGYQRVTLSE